MFFLQKEMERLDIPEERVLCLYRSLGDATVALPGFSAQRTTAYLCIYKGAKGVRIAVVLHLKTSGRLAFYLNEEGEVGKRQAPKILDAAIYFGESMGFMLNDMEIERLPAEERSALWQALPIQRGAPPPWRALRQLLFRWRPLTPGLLPMFPLMGLSAAFRRRRPVISNKASRKFWKASGAFWPHFKESAI